jgi:RHS repeat-associated protein
MYGYDMNSRMVWGFDETYGTTVSGNDYVAGWQFDYDAEGRLTDELLYTTGTAAGHALGERSVKYDKAGRRTAQRFLSANQPGHLNLDTTQTYTYDATKKWLTQIQRGSSATEKANYEYDPDDGRLTKITYGNAARTEYVYYSAGALSKISHFANGGTLFASVVYDYDLAGNVTKATLDDALANPGDAVITYGYDNLHRLVREDCAPQGSSRQAYRYCYQYDAVGNRTAMYYWNGSTTTTTTYEYSARNELTKTTVGGNDTLLNYDLRGNLTKKGTTEYYWSSSDRLTKVYDGSKTVEYKYDLLGRRVAKRISSGDWKWYFYDGLQVMAEGTTTSSRLSYTNSPSVIGGIITRGDGSTTYTYHFDRLGNVMAVTDTSGNAYAVYTMEAFGNVLEKGASTGYSSEHAADPQPYHLTTKEYDPDIALYYFKARWYDSHSGRFLSRARMPVFVEHPYALCDNSPTYFVDPAGLFKLKERNKPDTCCAADDIGKQADAIRERLGVVNGYLTQEGTPQSGTGVAVTDCYYAWCGLGDRTAEIRWISPWPKEESCLNFCGREHEMVHAEQCRKMGPAAYKGQMMSDSWVLDKPAYEAEKACLERLLNSLKK